MSRKVFFLLALLVYVCGCQSQGWWFGRFQYPTPRLNKEYDFIIVGAGNAGCVLANRLSKNPKINVLLIEAGKAEIPLVSDIPVFATSLQATDFNYGYVSEPQTRAFLGLEGNRCNLAHGKGLGGSSIINYMIWTRGNKRDFDSWSEAGNLGWSYEEVLPYFKKIETYHAKNVQDNAFHGFTGPVSIEDVPYRTKIAHAFVKSAQLAGYPQIDINSDKQIGVSYVQQSTKNTRRTTSAKAYLQPVAYRKNLHILTNSKVSKIIINKTTSTAERVVFWQNRQQFTVKATKEVILCAGSFESPKLLMLSGIGPAKDLKDLNIDVLRDMPVGQNLYDHVAVLGPMFTVRNSTDGLTNLENLLNKKALLQYAAGHGPYTTNAWESFLFMKTNLSESLDLNYPDIEIVQAFVALSFDTTPAIRLAQRLSNKTYNSVFRSLQNQRSFHMVNVLLHPRSKGYMKLRTNSTWDHPLFYPNYLHDDHDIETLVAGIKESIRIGKQNPFLDIDAKLYQAKVPGCNKFKFDTHDYWRCYTMHLTSPMAHQVGSCKMGPSSDPEAIVDNELRVHGFNKLRVADTSIIPKPPSGHTSAPSYMIGERLYEFLKKHWSL